MTSQASVAIRLKGMKIIAMNNAQYAVFIKNLCFHLSILLGGQQQAKHFIKTNSMAKTEKIAIMIIQM